MTFRSLTIIHAVTGKQVGAFEIGFKKKNYQKIAVLLSSLNPGKHQRALMAPRVSSVNVLCGWSCPIPSWAPLSLPRDAGAAQLMPSTAAQRDLIHGNDTCIASNHHSNWSNRMAEPCTGWNKSPNAAGHPQLMNFERSLLGTGSGCLSEGESEQPCSHCSRF